LGQKASDFNRFLLILLELIKQLYPPSMFGTVKSRNPIPLPIDQSFVGCSTNRTNTNCFLLFGFAGCLCIRFLFLFAFLYRRFYHGLPFLSIFFNLLENTDNIPYFESFAKLVAVSHNTSSSNPFT